jgi:hypothetical protein
MGEPEQEGPLWSEGRWHSCKPGGHGPPTCQTTPSAPSEGHSPLHGSAGPRTRGCAEAPRRHAAAWNPHRQLRGIIMSPRQRRTSAGNTACAGPRDTQSDIEGAPGNGQSCGISQASWRLGGVRDIRSFAGLWVGRMPRPGVPARDLPCGWGCPVVWRRRRLGAGLRSGAGRSIAAQCRQSGPRPGLVASRCEWLVRSCGILWVLLRLHALLQYLFTSGLSDMIGNGGEFQINSIWID